MLKNSRYKTQSSQYSTTVSRITQRTKLFQPQIKNSRFNAVGNKTKTNQTVEEQSKLDLAIKKRNINRSLIHAQYKADLPKVNPEKYRINFKSIGSNDDPECNMKFGISTCKGFKNFKNMHQIGVHSGLYNYIFVAEGYDGEQAAKLAKNIFPFQFNRFAQKEMHQQPQKYLNKIYKQTQHQIMKQQHQMYNNSGTSLLSVFFLNQLIVAANCGATKALCCTKTGQLLTLGKSHSTKNKQQLSRVLQQGGKIYQTVVEVKQDKNIAIQGPLRLSKSGLCYTRTLGKYELFENPEISEKSGLIYTPQIIYVNKAEVKWVAILSQNIIGQCSSQLVKEHVENQLKLLSQQYCLSDIAKESSKKLLQKMLNLGITDSITIIIIFPEAEIKQNQKKYNSRIPSKSFNDYFQALKGTSLQRSLIFPQQ